jgi:hypothetical protein
MNLLKTLVMLSAVMLTSCFSPNTKQTIRLFKLAQDDVASLPGIFRDIKEQRELPGFKKGEVGTLYIDSIECAHFFQPRQYPTFFIAHATKVNDPHKSVYTYLMSKKEKHEEWRLTSAWQVLPDGSRKVFAINSNP